MAAQIGFCEDYGIATGFFPRGSGRITGQSNWNWSTSNDPNNTFSDYPITAGSRSFAKFNFLTISGNFNLFTGLLWSHTGDSNLGIGLGVSGFISGSGFYTTPSASLPTLFSYDFTPTGVSYPVLVGQGGPEGVNKASGTITNPSWSQYIGHQLATLSSAQAGTTTGIFYHNFTYTEN